MTEREVRAIELGNDAQSFVGSRLGGAFVDKAIARRQAALEKMAKTDPTDEKALTKLQNEARTADWFKGWLDEIFDEAKAAMSAQEQETFTDAIP